MGKIMGARGSPFLSGGPRTSGLGQNKFGQKLSKKKLRKRRKMMNRFLNGKIQPPHQRPPIDTIVLSDSDDDTQSGDGDGLATTDGLHSTSGSSSGSLSKTITNEEPLFYESRSPNDGRDIKPIYNNSSQSMGATLPSSTPIEETPANNNLLCEYSLISDTSLAFGNETMETIVVPDDSTTDMIRLDSVAEEDSTVRNEGAGSSKQSEEEVKESSPLRKDPVEGIEEEEIKSNVPLEEKGKPSLLDTTVEDGEIVDVTIDDDLDDGEDKGETKETGTLDDSVIFVSEVKLRPNASRLLKPLNTNLKHSRNFNKPLLGLTQKRVQHIVQTLKEKAASYRNQMFEKKEREVKEKQQALDRRKKRMIIIDGSNVAFGHSDNGRFSARGLEICLDHFLAKGFDVKAVIPQFRMKRVQTDNHKIMLDLEKKHLLIKTPSKDLCGETSASYDDRFILNIAKEFDAVIVSNDHYRDLILENDDWRFLIYNRVIGYTWVANKIFFPDDPYGKKGPNLEDILYIKPEASTSSTGN